MGSASWFLFLLVTERPQTVNGGQRDEKHKLAFSSQSFFISWVRLVWRGGGGPRNKVQPTYLIHGWRVSGFCIFLVWDFFYFRIDICIMTGAALAE